MLRCFIGYDPIDAKAYEVAEKSLLKHASIPLQIERVWDRDLRKTGIYWRPYRVSDGKAEGEINGQMYDLLDGKPFSTAFSFTRFAVPIIANTTDWVLFMDPDMLVRADIAELLEMADETCAIMCVKHDHDPDERVKMGRERLQTRYVRKNWSSLMLMRPDKCRNVTQFVLNNWSGADLHALRFVSDEQIGGLPESWNWLEGWSNPALDPKIVHYTRGTPDMEGHEEAAYADEWREYLG